MFGYFDACVHGSLAFSSSTKTPRVYPRCRRNLDWHRLAIGGLYRPSRRPGFGGEDLGERRCPAAFQATCIHSSCLRFSQGSVVEDGGKPTALEADYIG